MPSNRNTTIESAIRDLATDAVHAALSPYTDILKRLKVLVADAPRRGPGRPPKAAGEHRVRSRWRPAPNSKKAIKAAKKLEVGQGVSYRQGRGSFDATVVGINLETGIVRVERVKDGKEIERPAHKLGGIAVPTAMDVVEAVVKGPKPARRAARGSAKKAIKAANKFKLEDVVTYQQGRGTFGAKVVEIDAATGVLTIERLHDGKKVMRPATKVTSADVAGPSATDEIEKPTKKERKAKAKRAGKGGPKVQAARPEKKAVAKRVATVEGGKKAMSATSLTEGQLVVCRQGKGAFRAEIVGIDHEAGKVQVKRESDGKVVTRPAGTMQPTDAT